MILANARARLSGPDFRLVLVALARHGVERRSAERQLEAEGPDALLDAPGLLDALLALRTLAAPSAPLFAYVAVRHTLLAAGINDRELADYLAALLLEFGAGGRNTRIGSADDQTYTYLFEIVSDLGTTDASGERSFLLRAHLGNFSLWIAGLFPDWIATRHRRRAGPDVTYYDEMGRRGFRLAAEHDLAGRYGVADLYHQVARQFPVLRQAFNRLSDRVLFPDVRTDDRLLRGL